MDDLLAIEGVGLKTVQDLVKKIKKEPEATEVKAPEDITKQGYVAKRVLVLKWRENGVQFKSNVVIGQPLPEIPEKLAQELLQKGQIQRGLMTKEQVADAYGVELTKE